ncbi:MAG: hypothetical protein M0R06_02910 [Sphaerochaeta sp.]|nr:hypothetical protein [Sphaerochaeta sp.]
MKTDYEKQAINFLKKTGVSLSVEYLKHDKHFVDDTETRDIYTITLKRGCRNFSFSFGQSNNASGLYTVYPAHPPYKAYKTNKRPKYGTFASFEENENYSIPSAYDVLACLTKYDPGSFENFCGDFGYDTDSRKAEKIYKDVLNEWHNVCMIWNENEIKMLQEIE